MKHNITIVVSNAFKTSAYIRVKVASEFEKMKIMGDFATMTRSSTIEMLDSSNIE